ncbi:hypothetical protein CRG98_002483 [Punica granatum]|uniref:Uncharacterized protein n=1 Tax=Punica granatum TaxID=22663 RepID=A0A2I0L8L4_PUNGR|nr:hypothetical protein CRG98_002483 [Punica granatum]
MDRTKLSSGDSWNHLIAVRTVNRISELPKRLLLGLHVVCKHRRSARLLTAVSTAGDRCRLPLQTADLPQPRSPSASSDRPSMTRTTLSGSDATVVAQAILGNLTVASRVLHVGTSFLSRLEGLPLLGRHLGVIKSSSLWLFLSQAARP